MSTIYISLGSNLGNKEENLKMATELIESQIGHVEQKSSIYSTEPWGYKSFNNYLNQVIEISSVLQPIEVMKGLLAIENKLGRIRADSGYEDRIIDLDILFFDSLILNSQQVQIPHPRIQDRLFILEPLEEIAQNYIHPKLKKSIKQLLDAFKED